MANTSPVICDFSDVAPSKNLLSYLKKMREISLPPEQWYWLRVDGREVAHACCVKHAQMAEAVLEQEGGNAVSIGTLRPHQGGVKIDYKNVRCWLNCKWRVA